MKRRNFLKLSSAAGLVTIITPSGIAHAFTPDAPADLEKSFLEPAAQAKPQTWWHWMNGNVTKEGITLDLEAMKKAGLGGFQNFDAGTGIPEGPVKYLSPEWLALKKHAIAEAERLGLEFTMHNCPGWSSSGGPWITPDISMQRMTWSEVVIEGGKTADILLPKPPSLLNYYKDSVVLAFPCLPGENRAWNEMITKITTAGALVDIKKVTGEDAAGLTIEPSEEGENAWVQFEFSAPFEMRSLIMYTASMGGGFGPATFAIESSADGSAFTKVADIYGGGGGFGSSPDALATVSFPSIKSKHFRLVSSAKRHLYNLSFSGAERLDNWLTKANYTGTLEYIGQLKSENGNTQNVAAIDPSTVLDISKYMNEDGRLNWQAPSGNWTILRIGHTSLGTLNRSAPSTGVGLECDKYSKKALQVHFEKMFQELLPVLEPVARKGTVGLLIDSYEVGMQNWTPQMREEFKKRRGYDFINYLPAMTGRIVSNTDVSERFLWDIRRTHADLMADNYYGGLHELCKAHGMMLYTQPYDRGPFEEMQIGSRVDASMGEFWAGLSMLFANNDTMRRTIKLSSSVAHTNGQKLVLAEAFTAEPNSGKWQQYPFGMKALGDYMFTQGMNRLTFHRFAHQPHPSALPGMTMGPWGTHFDRTNTWFLKGAQWLQYCARCQSLLQQGLFVADIAYFTGEDAPGFTPVRPHELDPTPPEGYDYDLVNAETILKRVKIKDGRITLPDGMSYTLLVLPPSGTMTLELLRKLHELVRDGMILVGAKPSGTPGLASYNDKDAEFNKLATEMWGESNATKNSTFGKGKIFRGLSLADILETLGVKRDFIFSAKTPDAPINYIHKTIDGTDVYFLANRRRTSENIVASFRVNGKKAEIWKPDTGEMMPVHLYEIIEDRIHIPLHVDPSGSLFVIFRPGTLPAKNITAITQGETELLATKISPVSPVKFTEVTNNFTITVWVKPEIDIALGRKQLGSYAGRITTEYFAIYPPSGEKLYGAKHAANGLTVGRNGIVLWEREGQDAEDVLVAEMPVSGWTYIAIIYKNGASSLYVNGTLVKEAAASGKTIHPGIDSAYQRDGAMYYNGDMTKPDLFPEGMDVSRIKKVADNGAPLPESPQPVEAVNKKGILFWNDGQYSLHHNDGSNLSFTVKGLGKPISLTDNWTISFPTNLGAPAKISMPQLMSLHKHTDDSIKHFSGTATYTKQFNIPAAALLANKRLYLDLGRVEVIAEVKINGKNLGVLWKPPYRIDITEAIKAGTNLLEVAVTNLWPNRLIGDEKLPDEADYVNGVNAGPYSVLSNGAITKLPDWYALGKPKPPGGRVTFTTWKHYHKDSPLLESGLLGPVTIRTAFIKKV